MFLRHLKNGCEHIKLSCYCMSIMANNVMVNGIFMIIKLSRNIAVKTKI